MTKLPFPLRAAYQQFFQEHFLPHQQHYELLAQEGQNPKTMVIACCDSRSGPETIFNCKPGELFVIRNIASQVPPFQPDGAYHGTSAALEYAVQALQIEHIVVLGHAHCGGIKQALSSHYEPLSSSDFIGGWLHLLDEQAEQLLTNKKLTPAERQTALEHLSIAQSLHHLRSFPWIKKKEQAQELSLHGLWFCIEKGQLWELDEEEQKFQLITAKQN